MAVEARTDCTPAEKRSTGFVVHCDDVVGYIKQDYAQPILFYHDQHEGHSPIKLGDTVTFTIYSAEHHLMAKKVRVVVAEAPPEANHLTGTVKWFNATKGYGFIVRDGDSEEDVFVHYSDILMDGFRELAEGNRVSFEMIRGEKGLKAQSVVKLDEPAKGVE